MVSIIVPVYNGYEFLKECLQSLLDQSFTDIEIIVVNDGSTDETPALLKQYENFKNVVVCHLSRNRGEAAATNVGIQIAKGKYIARMDADDISLADRLSLQVAALESDPDLTLVGAQTQVFGRDGESTTNLFLADGDIKCALLVGSGHLVTTSVIWRRDWFIQRGIWWNTSLPSARDLRFWSDAMLAGAKFRNLPETLVRYRIHDANASHQVEAVRQSSRSTRTMLLRALYPSLDENAISNLVPILEIQFGDVHLNDANALLTAEKSLLQMRSETVSLYGENRHILRDYVDQWISLVLKRIDVLEQGS